MQKDMKHRVVITGMGVVTPLGVDLDTFWNNLKAGKSGIAPISHFDASNLSCRIAGEIKNFDPSDYMERREARRMDRFAQLSVAAAKMALQDAELDSSKIDTDRFGVIVGSGIGGIKTFEEQAKTLIERGPARVSPFFVPMMIPDMASGQVSILLGLRGFNSCSVTACASGTHSIGDAFKVIQRGDADRMLAGGAEAAVTELAVAGFCSARALSQNNDNPEKASRPFDLNRDGFVMSEGAAIILLESLDSAVKRDAKIYAELIGYSSTADAYHITAPAPEGDGAARAMQAAIEGARIVYNDVEYINAHGTSTEYNDYFETLAIKRVFKEHAERVAISSIKSMIGHLLGAGGGVEAVSTVLTIKEGIIPPTINLDTPDPKCDLDYVPNKAREQKVETALSNSFGFGGHNAVLVIRKYQDR